MKITKKFTSKKDNDAFINYYFNGQVESELIDNLLYSDKQNKDLVEYELFLNITQNGMKNLHIIQLVKHFFAQKALKQTFENKDFAIDELPEKSIWIVEFDGNTFLTPYKNEIIYNDILSPELIKKALNFEKVLFLLCLDYAQSNINKLNKKEKEILNNGLIVFQ